VCGSCGGVLSEVSEGGERLVGVGVTVPLLDTAPELGFWDTESASCDDLAAELQGHLGFVCIG